MQGVAAPACTRGLYRASRRKPVAAGVAVGQPAQPLAAACARGELRAMVHGRARDDHHVEARQLEHHRRAAVEREYDDARKAQKVALSDEPAIAATRRAPPGCRP